MENESELVEYLKQLPPAEPCMSLCVNIEGDSVEFYADTYRDTYLEWIKGEGADIGLLRCRETEKVVGIHLPLLRQNLRVSTPVGEAEFDWRQKNA